MEKKLKLKYRRQGAATERRSLRRFLGRVKLRLAASDFNFLNTTIESHLKGRVSRTRKKPGGL